METDALWKPWKNKTLFFHRSHSTWKTLYEHCEFSTVPTADTTACSICFFEPKTGHFYFGKNRTFLFWLDMRLSGVEYVKTKCYDTC